MSKSTTTLLVVLGIIVALGGIGLANFIGAANLGNKQEQLLKASLNDNKNVLASYTTKIVEMAQVPDMQVADLTKVIQASMQGRYGDQGAQATFQAIKEAYPGTVDNKLYERLQSTMEAGRNDFSAAQTRLLDRKRVYETQLGSFPTGFFLKLAGYPKIDLDTIKIITNAHTDKAYDSGVDEGVKLRPAA